MTFENQTTDCKSLRTVTGKTANWDEIAKDCVCFANGQGGRLLIGIEDGENLPPAGQSITPDLLGRLRKRICELTQRERITLGLLALSEGMTARVLTLLLDIELSGDLTFWLGRLLDAGLVKSSGRTKATRYFVEPSLLRESSIKLPTTLKRIEPHRLLELIREDLRRYPLSKIGNISSRIGAEINRSRLKRALADLTLQGVVIKEGELSGSRYRLPD